MEKVLPQQRGNFFVSNAPVFGSLWFALKGSQESFLCFCKKTLAFFEFLFYNDFRTNVFFGFQFVEGRRAA